RRFVKRNSHLCVDAKIGRAPGSTCITDTKATDRQRPAERSHIAASAMTIMPGSERWPGAKGSEEDQNRSDNGCIGSTVCVRLPRRWRVNGLVPEERADEHQAEKDRDIEAPAVDNVIRPCADPIIGRMGQENRA